MAIDTRDKRASAGSLLGWEILPNPDGTVGTPDRLHVSGLYSGIAAGAVVVAAVEAIAFTLQCAQQVAQSLQCAQQVAQTVQVAQQVAITLKR